MTTLKREDDRRSPSLPERVLMGVSVVITVLLLGYVSYHALTSPDGVHLEVSVVGSEVQDGDVWVQVQVHNSGATGVLWVTVELDCDTPAPEGTVNNVPAGGTRTITIVCPLDTTSPEASVTSFEAA